MTGMDPRMIGVVVIGRNEGERLVRCLRSILTGASRVVYVDSGSTDGSVQHARSAGVQVIELDLAIPFTAARARNAGVKELTERWPDIAAIQVIDGDCELAADWIDRASRYLQEHPKCAVVCGRRRERFPNATVYNRLIDLEWDTPVGETKSCGGDALFRRSAFDAAGGYRSSMIAGEEPELCFRLRQLGWAVMRLDAEMTIHDAAMSRFGEFWKRAKRAGHAYAESASIHGKHPERFGIKQVFSAVLWGGFLPVAAICLAWWTLGVSMLVWFMLLVVQCFRIHARARQRGRSIRDARLIGFATLLAKPAQLCGVLLFAWRKLTGREPVLIEYKSHSKPRETAVARDW